MLCLAHTFDLVFDRGVCCVGHGKSIVDGINGTDKNVILWVTARKPKEADETDLMKALKTYKFDGEKNEKVSVAENCKQLLEHDYKQQRLRKRVKKEGRSITNRYWHVRDINEELNESKYNTILFNKSDGVTFVYMYHFLYVSGIWFSKGSFATSSLLL